MNVRLVNKDIKQDYVAELLRERGVEDVQSIMNPVFDLQDPFDLSNMEKAVQTIMPFIESKKPSVVGTIVDSDCDGISSASIIYLYLERVAPHIKVDYYLHEGKGHGFSDVWREMIEKKFDLIIVADAATNDRTYIEKFDCPVIVADHHLHEGVEFASNAIVVNNQISPNYGNKELTGAGVALQLIRAIDACRGTDFWMDYVDLAAVGVDGDMGSGLEPENQGLWRYGFSHVKNSFLKALIEKQDFSMKGKVNPTSVAFYIVPLINAMIRVGTAEEKERMFLAVIHGDELIPSGKRGAKGTLDTRANESVRECTNMRSRQNRILEQAESKIENKILKNDLLENKILVIRLEEEDDFPSELNGLLAMRCAARYKRPTIVARLNDEGMMRGSARGLNGCAIASFKDYMDSTHLFEYTLGHDNACGISIANENLFFFHQLSNENLKNVDFGEKSYDVNFSRSAANPDLAAVIEDITDNEDIWSSDNSEPLLFVHDINLQQSDLCVIGKNSDTLKWVKYGITYIMFFAKDKMKDFFNAGRELKVNIVGKANMNVWGGHRSPQIIVEGYEVENNDLGF